MPSRRQTVYMATYRHTLPLINVQSSTNCWFGYLSANLTLRHVQSSVLSESLPVGKQNVRIGGVAICRPTEVLTW